MDGMDMNPQTPLKNGGNGTGPVIAIIVIVIILVLGGLYYFTQTTNQTADTTAQADNENLQALMEQGSDDTAAAIQADVTATDLTPVQESVADVDSSLE